jgi:putative hemolysin
MQSTVQLFNPFPDLAREIGQTFVNRFSNGYEALTRTEIPALEIHEGRYAVRFARTTEEIDEVLRLRFEIFNIELGEGLDASHITGRDEDAFDAVCHHLIVVERQTGKIVGTYRLQTLEMTENVSAFYCAGEFDLESLPPHVLTESLEIGRACIDREHRNTRVLFLLWKGLAAYARAKRKRYLFGCCSLTSQNPVDGVRAEHLLRNENHFHSNFYAPPNPEYICPTGNFSSENNDNDTFELPKLFRTYLRFGAKVCSPPAIDREFKTIDFFVIFDFTTMDEKYRQMFLCD